MKKVCALLIGFSLVLPQLAFGAGTGDNPTPTLDVPTKEQILEKQRSKKLEEEYSSNIKARMSNSVGPLANGETRTISVTHFKQETGYWCGPATVKQVLHFLNGSSKTQGDYAKELGTTTAGTDFSLIDDILNKHIKTGLYTYQTYAADRFIAWQSRMILSVDFEKPAVLDLKITPKELPNYTRNISGHILNVSGYDARDMNKAKIRLTDPFDEGGRGQTIGNKWYDMSGVWKANQAHFRKAAIV
ncbi:C39 family peptidase [Paenibacillus agilis]|uniref:Peptidase C39-like domain-containing protein n=1 Tax=Paenibacillus agilis TaxID=3020863 RepID=A0A559IKU3_9BACL|nr:C39 family peptidase [Paenibacillus agilis]TVX88093.1 hypothetical protein FPZ44_19480 [Paenibacillus agilis]